MLFDFSLRPLEEVLPWGKSPDLSLSWFGFTEGFYRLKVGSDCLLNYSDKYVKYYAENFTPSSKDSFVEYYVVRLWEDILSMIPNALQPVPAELCHFLEMNHADWLSWRDRVLDWEEAQLASNPDEDEVSNICERAIELRRGRSLDSGYLQNSSVIWIWSTDSVVHISWDNQGIEQEGLNVWSTTRGNYSMSRADFVHEVKIFHEKLMFEMGQRVEIICNHWNRPEIHVDLDHLRYEQEDRTTWLAHAYRRPPNFSNWDEVREAIQLIQT